MKIRYKEAVGAGLALLLSVAALPAATKKTKPESAKPSAEADKPSVVVTNETQPKIDLKVYKLSPTDSVEIRVHQEDDLITKTRIAKDGTITMYLLGVINIGGKTVEEAMTHIKALLAKDYLVNPQVTVTVTEYAKKWFHVLGEVNRPGSYAIPEEETMDIRRAIATAGGFSRIAKKSVVTVTRGIDGKKEPIRLDLKELEKKKKTFEILPDDTITVHESAF